MSHRRQIRAEFNHCDPAGIVFYPRYFEMTNWVLENFFREEVGYSCHTMMENGIAVPTARIGTDFRAPSHLGEVFGWGLVVERLGGSSVTVRLAATCNEALRLTARLILVWLGTDRRPGCWPDHIRAALAANQEDA